MMECITNNVGFLVQDRFVQKQVMWETQDHNQGYNIYIYIYTVYIYIFLFMNIIYIHIYIYISRGMENTILQKHQPQLRGSNLCDQWKLYIYIFTSVDDTRVDT